MSTERAAKWTAVAYGVLVALVLSHFVMGLPVQVSDSLGDILTLSASWSDLLSAQFTQQGFMRPFHWGSLKLVHDLSGGHDYAWYRGVHVLQVIVLVLLYLALARPQTWRDAAVLPLGLAVLIGLHTFAGTVREAFPINLYLTVMICCFATAALVLGPYRWWQPRLPSRKLPEGRFSRRAVRRTWPRPRPRRAPIWFAGSCASGRIRLASIRSIRT